MVGIGLDGNQMWRLRLGLKEFTLRVGGGLDENHC